MTVAFQIIEEVAKSSGISVRELKSQSRTQRVAWARQEAMWRMRRELHIPYPTIGRLFSRDHTTAIHGVRRHQARLDAADDLPAPDDDPLGFWPCGLTAEPDRI